MSAESEEILHGRELELNARIRELTAKIDRVLYRLEELASKETEPKARR